MNKKIADLILAWHEVYVAVTESIEHARIVLDQSDRGTLLPDRVREMRGHLIGVQESIPQLADLLEELTGEVSWPMTEEKTSPAASDFQPGPDAEASAEVSIAGDDEAPVTTEGDYDAGGSTPVEEAEVAATNADATAATDEETEAEGDATGAP